MWDYCIIAVIAIVWFVIGREYEKLITVDKIQRFKDEIFELKLKNKIKSCVSKYENEIINR